MMHRTDAFAQMLPGLIFAKQGMERPPISAKESNSNERRLDDGESIGGAPLLAIPSSHGPFASPGGEAIR